MDNLIQLPNFEVETIISTLKARYKQDKVYTSIGLILVAINPFKQLSIYSNEIMSRYSRGDPLDETCLPHVFRTAALCYRGLTEDRTNQSVVISGESGAGKSETTKLILEYLTQVAGMRDRGKCNLMDSNQILEALGNAKTTRNNNSSRFGKWMQVFFDKKEVCIVGTTIVNFLLEKTRVVSQAANERNYHMFYQFCEGASPSVKKEYSLLPAKDFNYLNRGKAMTIPGVNDAHEWEQTLAALDKLKFSAADVQTIQRVLAIVLHLGNLEIVNNAKDLGQLQNKDVLGLVGRMMGVEGETLEQVLLNRCVKVYSDVTWTPVSAPVAILARDALAKGLYGSLFDWVVKNIQNALAASTDSFAGAIGVLDIFGFELFQVNSLEQLFINYANEKLQQLFNQCIFKQEQQEYTEEGLKLGTINFVDNIQVCTLIDGKGGILRMIEEEGVVPSGSDEGLLQKLVRTFGGGKHPNFDTIRTNQGVFVVKHYAGEVTYTIEGFVEKNKDKVGKEVITMALASHDKIIHSLFKSMDASPTLSKGFQASLSQLNSILEATQLHFVRCIKPNSDKKPNNFQESDVIEQIHNAGLIQAVEIRKAGYSNRKTHRDFAYHYRCLAPKGMPRNSNPKAACELIKKHLISLNSIYGDIQIGKTKVFWRTPQELGLSKLRNEALQRSVKIIQHFLLVVRAKARARARREVIKKCEAVLRTKDAKFAQDTLKAAELHRVQHPMVTKVRELLNLQKDLAQQITKLQQAIKGPIDKLPLALSEARQFHFSCPNKDLQALIKSAETKVQAEDKKNSAAAASAASASAASSAAAATMSAVEGKSAPPNRAPPSNVPPRMKGRPTQINQADVNVEIADPVKRGLNTAKPTITPSSSNSRQHPLSSFADLRTKMGYIKGFHMNKEEQSARMLVWQDFAIMRSLTVPDRYEKEHVHPLKRVKSRRVCIDMHKNILGFMGDTRAVYPNPLGYQVLSTAFYNPLLRDEMYCQLIKQTSSNPTSSSANGKKFIRGCLVGLKLVFICLCYFTPSTALTNILVEHLQSFQPPSRSPSELKLTNEKDVAALCLLALKAPQQQVLPKMEDFSSLVNFAGSGEKAMDMVKIFSQWSASGGEGSCPNVDLKEEPSMPSDPVGPQGGLFATLTSPLRGLARDRNQRRSDEDLSRTKSPGRLEQTPPRESETSSMSTETSPKLGTLGNSGYGTLGSAGPSPSTSSLEMKRPKSGHKKPPPPVTRKPVRCSCGTLTEPGEIFCSDCGAKVNVLEPEMPSEDVRKCTKCGVALEEGHKFCLSCGTRVPVAGPIAGLVDPVKLKRELQEREQVEREGRAKEEKTRMEQERRRRENKEANDRADRERESRERIERAKREKEERDERIKKDTLARAQQEADRLAEEKKRATAGAPTPPVRRPQTQAPSAASPPVRSKPPPPAGEPVSKFSSATCRHCHVPMKSGERFCTECGKGQDAATPVAPSNNVKKKCVTCGADNEGGFKFCLGCGKRF